MSLLFNDTVTPVQKDARATYLKSIRTPELSKEDAQIQEIENEYPPLEEMYNTTIAELEASVTGNKYLGEFCQLWDALVKRQTLIITVAVLLKEQQSTILSLNNDLTDKLRVTQTDQESIDRLKQEINNSLKMIDATHAREQVAQETIENLRQQIARLNTEMELKAKMEMDQDGEFATMTKNKELQQKEKEKVERELTSLKEKLRSVTADHDNLEEKYNATSTKLTELTQDIENKVNEIQKEVQLKLRLEDEVISLSKTLETKNTELLQTATELRDALKKSRKSEQQVNREKAEKEQLKQDYSELNQRFLMFQEEFSAQARQFSEVGQKINIVGCEMKRKEEQIVQSKTEITKFLKIIETLKAKYERVTLKSKKLVTERDKIAFTIKMKEKEMQHLRKAVEHEKRNVQNALRQKEQEVKAKGVLEAKVLEITRRFGNSEQIRQNLQIDIESHEKGIAKLKQMVRVLEKDKDRYIEEAKALTTKVEALMDEIRTKTAQIFSLKREILEGEAQFKQQQNLFDVIRTERNACAKELLEAQDEISEFKAKMKVMMHQVEQLKEDISCKESQLTREELAYRKLQSEKEAYRVEVQRWKDVVKENKRVVDALREEVAEVKRAIDVSEARRYKLRKEMDSIMNERDILGSQLVRRNDEITLLYEKVRILQVTLDRGKSAYNLRIDEIRILKLEVENLRGEKNKLTKIVNNTTDFRTEIYHLERDLTKERLKSRALEEELQTPLNIHRWRKLGGSDPNKLELIQKIQILQKRLLKGITESQVQQKKLEESNRKYSALQEELSRQPGPDIVKRLGKTQHALKMKTKNSQCLMGQVAAYKSEIVDLNLSLQHLRNELLETKKLYFEQKKKCEKYKEQLDELTKPKEENDMVDVIFPPIKQKLSNGMVNGGSNTVSNQNKSIEKTIGVITRQSF